MAGGSFDHVDKDFDSFKKISTKISLSNKDYKDLQEDAERFAKANPSQCAKVPRLYNTEIWKSITKDFVENDKLGENYWNADREGYEQEQSLSWPDDQDDILFLAFCVLKCMIRKVGTNNKRKGIDADGEELDSPTRTPKKAKKYLHGDANNEDGGSKHSSVAHSSRHSSEEVQEREGLQTPAKKIGRPKTSTTAPKPKAKAIRKAEAQTEALIKRSQEYAKRIKNDENDEDEVADDEDEDDDDDPAVVTQPQDFNISFDTIAFAGAESNKVPEAVDKDIPMTLDGATKASELSAEQINDTNAPVSIKSPSIFGTRDDHYFREGTPPTKDDPYYHSHAVARDVSFKMTSIGHENRPILLTCSSSATFPHLWKLAEMHSSGAPRFALAKCTKCKIVIPGGATLELDFPNDKVPATWSGAMTMAEAAVGNGNLYAGQQVCLEFA